jgi:hypothetical protein
MPQVQQRKALIAERLRAHGAAASATLEQHGISPSSRLASRSTGGSAPSPTASPGVGAGEAGSTEAQQAVLREAQAAELAEQGLAAGNGQATPSKYPAADAGVDVEALFQKWLQRVSGGGWGALPDTFPSPQTQTWHSPAGSLCP